MTPTVPLSDCVRASEALQFRWSLNAHSTFDSFEAASIPELPTDRAEIDMGMIERQVGKVGDKHRKIKG
jgi:hypothetical protein